jgi:rhomboid protease GluP
VAQGDAPGPLDRLIDLLARGLDAVGLNGTRLRWRWNQRRRQLGEAGLRGEILWRSGQGRHKMCPECRALVPRSASKCSECNAALTQVRAPGYGRLLGNLLPQTSMATALILLVNGFWFLVLLIAQTTSGGPRGPLGGLLASFDGQLLVLYGSGVSWLTLGGETWRLITPIFLHAGLIHFFFNSYVLMQLGPLTESEFGTTRFWCVYLGCGLAGSAASQWLHQTYGGGVNTVGASGANLGLIGLLLAYGWRQGGARGEALRQGMVRYVIYIAIFSLLIRGIDHVNHAGGFVCGLLLGLVLRPGLPGRQATGAWQAASLAGVIAVLWAFYRVAVGVSALSGS